MTAESDRPAGPKFLTLDIESGPHLGYVWSLWKQNLSLDQLVQAGEVIAFAAKWRGKRGTEFYSVHEHGREEMIRQAWRLLDEADIVCHYNGDSFDIPYLQQEMARLGLGEPSPYKNIDLLKAVKRKFRLASNKLDYVARYFGLSGKLGHTGFKLWLGCLAGDAKSWALMERYNRRDVVVTEKLHDKILGWIPSYPALGLYHEDPSQNRCACGGTKFQRRGFAYTSLGRYQRWQCAKKSCGRWYKSAKRDAGVDLREVKSA